MADIAFLLLIFFLVTAVIPNDQGFNRKLPKLCDNPPCESYIHERNVLQIQVNANNEIMVNSSLIGLNDFQKLAMDFIDNNGDGSCNYCNGKKDSESSDNPKKAVISLVMHPKSNYNTFIKVQDELTKAYKSLRTNYAARVLGKSEDDLTKEDIILLREVYPFIVSEAEINRDQL